MNEIRIAPSILTADFARLGEVCAALEAAGADWIHLDMMDGRFVPNLTFGPMAVEAVRRSTRLPLDAHLMIVEPERYVGDFIRAGAQVVTVHAEACPHLHRVVHLIRESGAKAGVALNPATSPEAVSYVLGDLDLVLCMTVNPGFAGQSYIPWVADKVRAIAQMVETRRLSVDIQVDGGINRQTVGEVARAGARVFVTGSSVLQSTDWKATIDEIRQAARSALGGPVGFRVGS
jgi:ribulose-phosphate 3-epimerase